MSGYEWAMRPDQALAEAVRRCALDGRDRSIINAAQEVVWDIEADSKVDDDDLTFPVIVHMRGGSLLDDSVAIIIGKETVE